VISIRFNFHRDGQFLAKQMVNFSSLHDEGRPADIFYHHRRDTLVNALQMAVLIVDFGSRHSPEVSGLLAWGGPLSSSFSLHKNE
jgi:hypothetical protein